MNRICDLLALQSFFQFLKHDFPKEPENAVAHPDFSEWEDLSVLNHPKAFSVILVAAKGQLISKCPFGVIVWTKIPIYQNTPVIILSINSFDMKSLSNKSDKLVLK